MNNTFGKDLTVGSIPKQLISFSVPILLGNLLTTGYSIINAIWVGNILGRDGVGAIGVCFPIVLILVALGSGATLATSILISQYFGAKKNDMIQKVSNNSLGVAVVIIPIVTVIGLLTSDMSLKLLGTSGEIMPLASSYLKITFAGFVFLYLSFLITAVLRGIGDTVTPMIFMIVSTVCNAVLDPLMIIGIGFPKMGLNGAALASLISTAIATTLGFIYIRCKYSKIPINPNKLELDSKLIGLILKIGVPSFIQQALISISSAFVISFVNGFGAIATAAFGITSRIDSIIAMPAIAMMMSASTLTAQNVGAGKHERIKEVFKWGIIVNLSVILVLVLLIVCFPVAIMHMFVRDEAVVAVGVNYLRIVGTGYILFAFSYVSNGIINGAGKTMATMVISFISLCLIRIPLTGIISHTSLGLSGIWIAIDISFLVTAVASLSYYFLGKWRMVNVEKMDVDNVGAS